MAVLSSPARDATNRRRGRAAPWLRRWTVAPVFLACVALAASVHGATVGTSRANEYRVKAAILYNIARFIDWPAAAFATGSSPVVVCVVGVDPFGSTLEETLQGRTVRGRPVTISRSHNLIPGCHVVFIAYSEQKRIDDIVGQLGTMPVLSISEIDRFTDRGGIIGLTTEGDRVQFEINASAADRAKLTVSARLLAAASSVRGSGGTTR
jgi:hypothetical protein